MGLQISINVITRVETRTFLGKRLGEKCQLSLLEVTLSSFEEIVSCVNLTKLKLLPHKQLAMKILALKTTMSDSNYLKEWLREPLEATKFLFVIPHKGFYKTIKQKINTLHPFVL